MYYSGFGDLDLVCSLKLRRRRIALSDIERISTFEPLGCDCWPIPGRCYFPTSENTVVLWLKPEKQAVYERDFHRLSNRRDRVEIRYVQNPDEFLDTVQRQIDSLP